jgi:hypothetical protein
LRRRAENLIKGLQRHLTDKDLLEQEQRESDMQSAYQQWKQIVEFCAEKERQLQLMQVNIVKHCQCAIQWIVVVIEHYCIVTTELLSCVDCRS